MTNPADGYLIPGEVAMGNCYKVFIGKNLVAIVKNEQAALNLIRLFKLLANTEGKPAPTMTYQLAFIEGIGF